MAQDKKERLIDAADCVLCVIDIQDHFLDKYDNAKTQNLLAKAIWTIEVAKHLDVPIVAMAEDIEGTGPLSAEIGRALPEGSKIHDKDAFGLSHNTDILAAVDAHGRGTAVLIGVETDVCVAQSALGLLDQGYRVVVPRDAVATTDGDEEIGLARMREAGAIISSVKAVYYEWIRTVSKAIRMRNEFPILEAKRPSSLVL